MAGRSSGPSVQVSFAGPSAWEAASNSNDVWGVPPAAACTPAHYHHGYGCSSCSGATAAAAETATLQPYVFHTTESLALESPPSAGRDAYSFYQHDRMPTQLAQQWVPGPPAHHVAAPAPPPEVVQQLEQQNAELAQCCHELQEQLRAAAAASTAISPAMGEGQASPLATPGSTHHRRTLPQQQQRSSPPVSSMGEVDREEVEQLRRRLASKQREAEAAAAALAAKQQQAAAREAELEEERGRSAALADQVAHWKDECAQRERELRALQQRLESASSHAGLLEDGGAALRKKNAELSTQLAQRDVAIRQLEDRLRALQGSEGNKERQLEAMHGEGEAVQRENTALRQQNSMLQREMQRLEQALARGQERTSALQSRNSELAAEAARKAAAAVVAASPPLTDRHSSSGGDSMAEDSGGQYQPGMPLAGPASGQRQQQWQQFGTEPSRYASGAEPNWPASSRSPPLRAGQYMPPAAPLHSLHQAVADPRASWQHVPYRSATPPAHQVVQQQQQHQLAWQLPPPQQAQQQVQDMHGQQAQQAGIRASHSEAPVPRSALQRHNHPGPSLPGPGSRYGKPSGTSRGSASAADASDACSLSSYTTGPPAASPVPWQLRESFASGMPTSTSHQSEQWQQEQQLMPWHQQEQQQHHHQHQLRMSTPQHAAASVSSGSEASSTPQHRGDADADSLSARLSAVALGTPGAVGSPFGTEDTLQAMLAQTQALEDRLLALNAEKNELEAESSRMPSHTTGRTLQERKRRAEVERRLDAINRECSSVRLQLRRLGVK